jgi:periplasmic protein TonB
MGLLIAILFAAILVGLIFLFKFLIDKRTSRFIESGEADSLDMNLYKKFDTTNIHKYTFLLTNIGLVFSLVIVITAFEWKDYDPTDIIDLGRVEDSFDEVLEIPPTEQPPPPPPKVQQPEIIEVPDEEELEEEIEVNLDVEVTEETVIEELVEEEPEEEDIDQVFLIVEEQPLPNGGMQAFYDFLGKKIRYPEQARRMGVEGRVFVEFVVGKDGRLTDVKVVKGIGAGCDEEAVRVVKGAPKWKPGKQRGRAVRVKMTVPVYFRLG